MPNYCHNSVVLTHADPAMVQRAKDAFVNGRFLEEFIPVPASLHIEAGRVGDDTDPEQIKLHEQTMNNLRVYGYANWYDFCVNEWGTKWEIGSAGGEACQDIPNGINFSFNSAWSPPIAAYEKLTKMGYYIEAIYYEPGMGFCGEWCKGEDVYYDIKGDADWVEENIPAYIYEAFGILEDMSQYEE